MKSVAFKITAIEDDMYVRVVRSNLLSYRMLNLKSRSYSHQVGEQMELGYNIRFGILLNFQDHMNYVNRA